MIKPYQTTHNAFAFVHDKYQGTKKLATAEAGTLW
jgi:hypothetical protein